MLAVKGALCRAQTRRALDRFYEKVIKVKADVAALPYIWLCLISTEKFALGSLRSDDWQLGRSTASPLLFVVPSETLLVLSVLHRLRVVSCEVVKGAAERRRSS